MIIIIVGDFLTTLEFLLKFIEQWEKRNAGEKRKNFWILIYNFSFWNMILNNTNAHKVY